MTEVRTDFITEVVAALRSDQYKQGTGSLRLRVSGDSIEYRYCCLGVFCEIGKRHGVIEQDGNDYRAIGAARLPDDDVGDWNSATLPNGFWQWIGFNRSDPQPGDEGPSLTSFNDENDMDFFDIADIIERTWLKAKVDA